MVKSTSLIPGSPHDTRWGPAPTGGLVTRVPPSKFQLYWNPAKEVPLAVMDARLSTQTLGMAGSAATGTGTISMVSHNGGLIPQTVCIDAQSLPPIVPAQLMVILAVSFGPITVVPLG